MPLQGPVTPGNAKAVGCVVSAGTCRALPVLHQCIRYGGTTAQEQLLCRKLECFNFDFWFVAPGPVSAGRGLSTGIAAATAQSAFAAPKGWEGWVSPGCVRACRSDPPSAPPFPAQGDQTQLSPGLSSHEQQVREVSCSLAPGTSKDSSRSHRFPQVSHCHPQPPNPFLSSRRVD